MFIFIIQLYFFISLLLSFHRNFLFSFSFLPLPFFTASTIDSYIFNAFSCVIFLDFSRVFQLFHLSFLFVFFASIYSAFVSFFFLLFFIISTFCSPIFTSLCDFFFKFLPFLHCLHFNVDTKLQCNVIPLWKEPAAGIILIDALYLLQGVHYVFFIFVIFFLSCFLCLCVYEYKGRFHKIKKRTVFWKKVDAARTL